MMALRQRRCGFPPHGRVQRRSGSSRGGISAGRIGSRLRKGEAEASPVEPQEEGETRILNAWAVRPFLKATVTLMNDFTR
jgi:hypothetical protein